MAADPMLVKSKPVILATCPIPTPLGPFAAHYSASGLARLDFPGRKTMAGGDAPVMGGYGLVGSARCADRTPQRGVPTSHDRRTMAGAPAASATIRRWHKLACRALARVLQGHAAGELPPLDLAGGTPFQRKVWDALRQIPAGQTESYGRLAAALGAPKAARAVGGACGANPIPLFIPCHRVVPSGGGLGGFSAGLPWKRRLLALEAGKPGA